MLARIKSLFVSTHCICVCVCVCVVTGLKCRFCLHINIHCKTEVFTGSDLWRSWKTSASHWNRAAATTSSAYPGLGQTSLESHQGWSGSLSGQPTLMLPRPLTVLLEPLHLQFLASSSLLYHPVLPKWLWIHHLCNSPSNSRRLLLDLHWNKLAQLPQLVSL